MDSPLVQWQTYQTAAAEEQRAFLDQIATTTGAGLDNFERVLNMLAYHGRLADLVFLMEQAWPHLQASETLSAWQKNRLATQSTDSLIFQYLAQRPLTQAPTPDKLDSGLMKQLNQFFAVDTNGLARYLAVLGGFRQTAWTPEQLASSRDNNQLAQNLTTVMIEFLGWLHQKEEHPLSKGDLFRYQMLTYLAERRTGQLDPRPDIGDLMRRGRPMPKPRPPSPLMCPDPVTLEQFLTKMLNYKPQPYKTAAFVELIPAWLRFLASRNLITTGEQQQTMHDLQPTAQKLATHWQSFPGDETLHAQAANWSNL